MAKNLKDAIKSIRDENKNISYSDAVAKAKEEFAPEIEQQTETPQAYKAIDRWIEDDIVSNGYGSVAQLNVMLRRHGIKEYKIIKDGIDQDLVKVYVVTSLNQRIPFNRTIKVQNF